MGIPSYFRRILQKYPGCLQKAAPQNVGMLCFDFNCLIYRCIRAPGMPSFPEGVEEQEAWEKSLLQEVRRTVKEVWKVAGSPKKVFLAVDGVVPMAKIRQQRVRRFKSAWMRRQATGVQGWDSNAITPGTAFMKKLTRELEGVCKEQKWELSSWEEPGEGEHKILARLRAGVNVAPENPIIVYGLDADLILLSLLVGEQTGRPLWLLREKQEFGPGAREPTAEQEYSFFNLPEFKERLGVKGHIETLNYVGLMSCMGNDFLPHSITHKLNDDGYEYVVDEFTKMCKTKEWIVSEDGVVNVEVMKKIWGRWAAEEADKFFHMIKKKQEQSKRGVGKGMDPMEGLPLEWMVEREFLDGPGLRQEWRQLYSAWSRGNNSKEYVQGLQWVMDYYLGKPVDMTWMFPSWIPPLWSELAAFCESVQPLDSGSGKGIEPEEQLAMVLPLESWGLLENRALRRLPALAPQLWPEKFEFFSLGRKWLWECEARIPCFTAARLREILNT